MIERIPKYRVYQYFFSNEKRNYRSYNVVQMDFEGTKITAIGENNERYYFDFKAVDGLVQYTESNDSHGNEIYEHDIVEYKQTSLGGYDDMIGIVKFMESAWCIVNNDRKLAIPLFSETAELTVIGNIYNDLDLIK